MYLPEYLQVVQGASAISSGLRLIPLTLGIVIGSVGSGQLVSRIGRYKVFPVVATLVFALLLREAPLRTTAQVGRDEEQATP